MKQTKAIITTLLLFAAHCASLPVTSKALENNSDQLIWQTAWYSNAQASPFTGDSKKISPKSIFITPNFDQSPVNCPPGFKIDDNGKCIKVVSINQDDLRVTRLQSFFSQHQTTDDSTSIDYDYSVDEEATHYDLPLIPIFNDTRDDQEIPESFLDLNNTKDYDDTAIVATTILPFNYLINGTENLSDADENSNETRVNESDINSDQNDTTTVDESAADTTPAFADQFEDESNYTTTTLNESVIKDSEKPQTEMTISSESHLGDYFDAMLQNDSLLIDDSFVENTTNLEFDMTTVEAEESFDEVSSGEKASVEIESEENTSTESLKTSSEIPYENQKLSSSEKASIELLNTGKATIELSNTKKASMEISGSKKASSELLSSQKGSSSSEKTSLELSSIDKTYSSSLQGSQKLSSSQEAFKELSPSQELLSITQKALETSEKYQNSEILTTEASPKLTSKAPFELLSKVPAQLLNKAKEELLSFTKFVTVEKTSSKPSIVNGPFLIFGQPLTRPSTVEKVTVKVLPESTSHELSTSSNPIENFEYSTFDNVDEKPTAESLKPANIFEFSTSEALNKTETSITTPTTTQNFEFTPSFPYENRIIKDDQQNSELESVEEANKFVYHHLPSADVSSTPPIVRFPSQQRVRFPDEPSRSSSFSWPRDNGLMRFWQEQPLINDFKIFSRGHSNFRRPSYRRIQ